MLEGSHSGLVRHLGKVVWEQSHRGFKSLTLRLRFAVANLRRDEIR